MTIYSVELCAGAGGQALGLDRAGVDHAVLMDVDTDACSTLKLNRPDWNVVVSDLRKFAPEPWRGADLVTGGFPCPPYSVAGKQLGPEDERDLFGYGLKFIEVVRPQAAMIENVKGILDPKFENVRADIREKLRRLGYYVDWRVLNASDFGVCQLRPRVVFVALRSVYAEHFSWPTPNPFNPPTVGSVLVDLMAERGWRGVAQWVDKANDIAPTIVGGSKRHGGPDLGPTRARNAWASLGVNGKSVALEAPEPGFVGMPRLTVRMVARVQGFPDTWKFHGAKTSAYRQVGNALPPPVAEAVAARVKAALELGARTSIVRTAVQMARHLASTA